MNMLPSIDFGDLLDKVCDFNNRRLDLSFKEVKHVNGNISYYELFVICTLVKVTTPERVLEIGTFNGRTTLNIANNLVYNNMFYDPPKVYTVDIPPKQKDNPVLRVENGKLTEGVDELGYMGLEHKLFEKDSYLKHYIHQIWSDSALLIPEKFPEEIRDDFWFDFIWVDGSHSYDYVKHDAEFAFKNIRPKGIILFHDYGGDHWIGVNHVLEEIYTNPMYPIEMYNIENTSIVVALPIGAKA